MLNQQAFPNKCLPLESGDDILQDRRISSAQRSGDAAGGEDQRTAGPGTKGIDRQNLLEHSEPNAGDGQHREGAHDSGYPSELTC